MTHNKCIKYVLFIVNIELLVLGGCVGGLFVITFVNNFGVVICPNYINLNIVINCGKRR